MRPDERRIKGAYPYFKLAVWDRCNACWRDGRRAHATIDAAVAEAERAPGRYRISCVTESGRTDLAPFVIEP